MDSYSKYIYRISKFSLVLNSRSTNPNSYLDCKIYLEAIGKSSELFRRKDTAIFKGKIRLKIRDSNFTWQDFSVENNRKAFFALLKQRPDTIKKLNLYGCAFTEPPKELLEFTSLEELNLDGNDLSRSNLTILASLKNLKSLDLTECNLSKFPTSILRLSKLEVLTVWNNKLTYIPDELYKLVSLKDLTIGNNNLKYLSPRISQLRNLESLETSSTDIRRYPNEMVKMKKLVEIYPSDSMEYIPRPLIKYVWGCDTIMNK